MNKRGGGRGTYLAQLRRGLQIKKKDKTSGIRTAIWRAWHRDSKGNECCLGKKGKGQVIIPLINPEKEWTLLFCGRKNYREALPP